MAVYKKEIILLSQLSKEYKHRSHPNREGIYAGKIRSEPLCERMREEN